MAPRIPPVAGFRFSGVAAGIKPDNAPDLGLIVAERPVPAAGVFTTNLVQAAPVRVARQRLEAGKAQVLLVNSGNANACTGKAGMRATLHTSARAAALLDVDPRWVVPASTGVIGELLPAEAIEDGLPLAVRKLGLAPGRFSRAILTTDKAPKLAHREVALGRGRRGTVLGIAKGAGMIHPRMATTLAFVVTDLPLSPALLRRSLAAATQASFNVATVDGETSTNDCILAMASGAAGGPRLKKSDVATRRFERALGEVLWQLAEQIVADGEGARHVAEFEVVGTRDDGDARRIAERVATSLLVKTAMHGRDANWGRILSAAGTAGVPFDPERVSIHVGGVPIVRRGQAVGAEAERRAARIMKKRRYGIQLRVGRGKGRGRYLTCDLGHGYVDVNAGYRS